MFVCARDYGAGERNKREMDNWQGNRVIPIVWIEGRGRACIILHLHNHLIATILFMRQTVEKRRETANPILFFDKQGSPDHKFVVSSKIGPPLLALSGSTRLCFLSLFDLSVFSLFRSLSYY